MENAMKSPSDCPKCNGQRTRTNSGNPYCKPCALSYQRNRYVDNKEKESIRRKKYYQENKEHYLAVCKKYREEQKDPIDQCYFDMHQRCENQNHASFKNYGGRNISVCERWSGSQGKIHFKMDMGPRAPGMTIERYDVTKNYEPSNCGWETRKVQMQNTRRSKSHRANIPNDSPIYYPYDTLTTIENFAFCVNMPLIIVKYRYAHNWDPSWILNGPDPMRLYKYKEYKYTMAELTLLTDKSTACLRNRIVNLGWSVEDAVHLPV